MKIKTIILFSCCVLPACHTSRSFHKTVAERDTASQTLHLSNDTSSTLAALAKVDGQLQLKWIKYDTDKPADPDTGKPPVKEEGSAQLAVQSESSQQSASTSHSDLKAKSEKSVVVKSEKESAFNIRSPVLKLLILLLVIFSIFQVRKQ